MVEEIKQTFKGKLIGELEATFVGKVKWLSATTIAAFGKFPEINDVNETTVFLSGDETIPGPIGLVGIDYLDHLNDGDIIQISGSKIRSLWREGSPNNSIFATGRCNSNCLMCSQPPMDIDDVESFYHIWRYVIDLMPDKIPHIGITGGEPTLMGEYLVLLINALHKKYDGILIDILSNGRLQALTPTIEQLREVNMPERVIWAVPLYSDYYQDHDYVVQAKDAFYQTLLGIHRLADLGFRIEIRVVVHKLTVGRLYELSKFIHLNIPFVHHIAFMGLEMIGYTLANSSVLLIDDENELNESLVRATSFLDSWDYNVSLYNMAYCQIDKSLWRFARQSISDWKNSFQQECDSCAMKDTCSGFFSWNLKASKARPIKLAPVRAS